MDSRIKVRIAVALDERGVWCAYGCSTGSGRQASDEAMEQSVTDMLDTSRGRCGVHYVEAELPVPEPVTVVGTVVAKPPVGGEEV